MKGTLHLTSNGLASYEVLDAEYSTVLEIATILENKFTFIPTSHIVGTEQTYMEFQKEGINVTLGWDIWCGCFLMAHEHSGNPYIQHIGTYLNTL